MWITLLPVVCVALSMRRRDRYLRSFLRHPRVEVILTPSEEITRLRREIEALHTQLDRLQAEVQRAQSRYGDEVILNLTLEDLLRAHGIRWR